MRILVAAIVGTAIVLTIITGMMPGLLRVPLRLDSNVYVCDHPTIIAWTRSNGLGASVVTCYDGKAYYSDMTYVGYFGECRSHPPHWALVRSPKLKYPMIAVSLATGWPFRCFRATAVIPENLGGPSPYPACKPCVQMPDVLRRGTGIDEVSTWPYCVIFSGFVGNIALYTLILGMMPVGGRLLREWRRRSRLALGLCPRCRYPRVPAPCCSECGWSPDEAAIRFRC
jgi:hypothetical protein